MATRKEMTRRAAAMRLVVTQLKLLSSGNVSSEK